MFNPMPGSGGVSGQMTDVHRQAVQSIPNGVGELISWDVEALDQGLWFDPAVPNRITVKETDTYIVYMRSAFASNATGVREITVQKNGVSIAAQLVSAADDGRGRTFVSTAIDCVAGDYIQGLAYQNSGVALDFGGDTIIGGVPPYLRVVKVGGGRVGAVATPEDWHYVGAAGEPVFENAWTTGATEAARFYKDSDGRVHLEGIVTGGTMDATIFTLPAEYRPDGSRFFSITSRSSPTNYVVAALMVTSVGLVAARVGSNVLISLDGVSFRAA